MAEASESEPITVEVEVPPADAPPDDTTVVVVETPPAPEGGNVDAVEIAELLAARERITNLERDLAELREQVANTQATAEQTAEIVSMESEIAAEQQQQTQEAIAEIQEEMQPPDIAPNNSHWFFRSRDEWKQK